MAGTSYTRQSTLTDGDTITASLFNDEYNQLINAFAYAAAGTTGHQHDGGAGEGGNIEIIGDQDFKNKITVDSTNNRWSVFVEVGGTAVEQVRIEDGVVYPVTDSDVDLGTNALRFKNAYIDSLTATGNLTVGGNITVTGNVDVDGIVEFDGLSGTGSVTVTDILDQDDMSGDSATALATQQSIKAYVDAQQDTVDTLGEILALSNTTAGTDISVSTDDKVQFRDSAIYINSSADGQLDIVADTEIQIAATTIDINGAINASGEIIAASLDISGNIDVDGVTNLDVVDIDGAVDMASTLTVASNIVVGGTVDGRDVATDGTKLDGIEASATADQSNAEIRTAVEAASDSNVFTDADHTKLNAIEASADVTDVTNVTAAGALMDSEVTNLAEVKAFDSSDYATAAQGATAVAALPKAGGAMTGAITTNSTFDGRDVATDGSKLDGIEASADVTDAANVTAAGALMDSELTAIASVKALNQGVATGNSPTFTNLTLSGTSSVKVPAGTTAQRDGTPANGMFRYNSTNEQFEGYQNSEWGAIGGGGGSNTFTTDAFTGNGSTAAYALSQVINSENNLMVFIAGVFQQQSAYSIATASGTTTLTFSTAPANTREIVIYSIASAVSGSNLNIDSMTGDGSDVTLSLTIAPVNENNTQVFIDGVYQSKANYSISGTTLTFSTAPPTGSAVEVMTMTQTEVNVPVDGTITSAKLSGDLTLPGSLAFADNEKATFGAGDDLQIYHDGTNSYIDEVGTGNLKIKSNGSFIDIQSNSTRINNAANNEIMATFVANGGVTLYHDNSAKIATTSTGIDVTGTVTIPDKIIHAGDTNTFLSFNAADQVQLVTGGVERVAFYNTETHFNDSGADVNFIVESDGNANMLFVDGGNNRVGIGSTASIGGTQLNVLGAAGTFNQVSVGSSSANNSITLGNHTSGDVVSNLITSSSKFGGLIQGGTNGNLVVGIRDNDVTDGFFVVSGAGNQIASGYSRLRMSITPTTVVFNESGDNTDFRIETNNKANAFRVDGGDDQVRTDAIFVHDADGTNQPFYITRSGGLDQALKVTMDDNNVMLTSVQDETSGANFIFYSTNATTSNLNMLQLDYSSGAVFNEGGVNYQHVRMESDADTHAFYLNAANGYIGMGAGASPTQPLSVGAKTGANLNYINGTANSVSTASGILISDTITGEGDTGYGLLLANNANNDNARSPIIGFSALSSSTGYNHMYAAINARKISNGADTNWNTGQLEFSTGSGTGPNIRMKLDRYGGLITTPTTAGHTVFNEDGADADFRVESAVNSNSLFVDGATGKVNLAGAAGSSGAPNLAISMSNSDAFNHATEFLNPNLTTNEVILSLIGFAASTKNSGYMGYKYSGSGSSNNNLLTFGHYGADHLMTINGAGAVVIAGSLSKGSGSFKIDHPLEAKKDTHHLVHSFIEGPQADNIYRGKVNLVEGSATVNIDTVSGMSEGTYVLLNTNTQCFTSNESGWTAVKGSVSGNILTITAQESCTDTISWMVVGERHDQHMLDTEWTDGNGKVIVEPLKELES